MTRRLPDRYLTSMELAPYQLLRISLNTYSQFSIMASISRFPGHPFPAIVQSFVHQIVARLDIPCAFPTSFSLSF